MNEEIEDYQILPNTALGEKQYFKFEEDFVEDNVRCIPMIVRLKMDLVGIKLKLSEWCKFSFNERLELAIKSADTKEDLRIYRVYLCELVQQYTDNQATEMEVDLEPAWMVLETIPLQLQEACKDFDFTIGLSQWKSLSNLQRFALLKLCKPGHENRNFSKAMQEFNLTTQ